MSQAPRQAPTIAPLPAGSPRLLRRINSALVLRTIRSEGPLSRTEIARATGLSKPTVNEVVELLLRAGWVDESLTSEDARPRRPGPRARLLRFRADLGHVLGIDIGANKALAMVADLGGEVLGAARRRTAGARNAADVLDAATAAAVAALEKAGVPASSLKAVAVGTPGVVDPETGRLTLAPQIPGWKGIDLAARLAPRFPCPVSVHGELHLSVLGERQRGAAQGIDDALYIQIGVGIGAGLLIGGELYRGAAGAAGEIGYLPLGDGDAAADDELGSFERAAGGTAFARLGRRAATRPEGALLLELAGGDPDTVDAEVVFEAARRGDPAATAVVDELVRRLARGVAAAVLVMNPSTVIIGGGLSRAREALLEPLEREVRALVPVPPRLVLSALGDEATALGAIGVALQEVDERFFHFTEAVAS